MVKKERELKQISRAVILLHDLLAVYWQAMTVTAVTAIVKPDFSEIFLPHPSTTASLMFLPIFKVFANRKS